MEVTDIDVPEQRERLQSIIPSLYSNGRALFETEHLARDGRRIPVEVSTRLFDLHGVPTVLSVARDVSERKLAARRLRSTLTDTIRAMGELVGLRDPYTARHEKNVTRLALAIATELHLDDERREGLLLAGEVHDIGKIAVPAEILSKPSALTPMEREIVEQHPVVGRSVLSGIDFYQPVADIVGQHHERLDGSGYPDGLSGDEILLEARILAVADVVEAMASHRPYRPALGVQPALEEVRAGAGLRYDADVVTAGERVIAAGFDLRG
jgi:putative nucleotidyltransferase with HDIG domain